MKRDIRFYVKLFLSVLELSAFTFGGGYVIVSLMRKKFVDTLGWLSEEEMLDFTAIAQSSPGAIAINASILIGFKLAGVLGAVTTIIATTLPPLVFLSVISYFYTSFINNEIVQNVLMGMRAGVAAVIVDVVIGMIRSCLRGKRERLFLSIAIMLASFVAVYFFSVNVLFIILICLTLGILFYRENKAPVAENMPSASSITDSNTNNKHEEGGEHK